MTNDKAYLPCGSTRCKDKHDLRELKPKYMQLVKDHDKLIIEFENQTKIISEGLEIDSPEVREIITTRTELKNKNHILELENKSYIDKLQIKKIELERCQKLLEDKSKEVLDFKDVYEKDEEIQLKDTELIKIENEIKRLSVSKAKLEKREEKARSKYEATKEEYNLLVDDYNKVASDYKVQKKAFNKLKRQTLALKNKYARLSAVKFIKNKLKTVRWF